MQRVVPLSGSGRPTLHKFPMDRTSFLAPARTRAGQALIAALGLLSMLIVVIVSNSDSLPAATTLLEGRGSMDVSAKVSSFSSESALPNSFNGCCKDFACVFYYCLIQGLDDAESG